MDDADAHALDVVRQARSSIARAAAAAAAAIGRGGRLIYVGAGTSGRLGVLDASECPPTFSASPGQVVGIIAGGDTALRTSVEGAEDDAEAGRAAVRDARVTGADMVVGISASGTAPYVLGAMEEAGRAGASVWLLSCSGEASKKAAGAGYGTILAETGREVIQGSTRLAAGTATKLVLNRITTAAFVMLGKVYGDLMVDVMPTNAKLVKRAVGIISGVSGCSESEAVKLLERSGGRPKVAVVMGVKGLEAGAAEALLDECGGFLRRALER